MQFRNNMEILLMAQDKEFIATITGKGQVTSPVEIRQQLGLSARDKIIFRLGNGNRVEIEPLPMSLEEAYGSVAALNRPEDFEELQRIANEEREERWLNQANK
jgi:AbrB family looped-hinge helix DNA binding protein